MISALGYARRVGIAIGVLVAVVALGAAALIASIVYGTHAGVARPSGTLAGLGVWAPVRIVRDERGVAHIRAQNAHDLYFAQGYVTGSDRLFQIDLTRRYVLGRLSEMIGAPLLQVDERRRTLDVRTIVERQYAALPHDQQALVAAFADGINAAAQHEPIPPEYRALLFSFERWRPQDALVVGFATTLDLADDWNEVIARDRVISALGQRSVDAFFSLSDPRYDSPTIGGRHVHIPPLPALDGPRPIEHAAASNETPRADVLGSNEWVVGAARTATGRALLANDPHLDSSIPGIWHLDDLAAPGVHVAGATLAGIPGIVLGHNAHLAWGSTNGSVVAPRVYAEAFTGENTDTYRSGRTTRDAVVRVERFSVRFGPTIERRYLTTRHGFIVEDRGRIRHAVQWYNAQSTVSPLSAFYRLNRARSIADARSALAAYPGPVQNFVVADDRGQAFYTVAGFIPTNADWGLRVRDGAEDPPTALAGIPFARLPHSDITRNLVANNSNNLPYAAGYPYRMSPFYSPPYRAAEIARDLRSVHRPYTAEDFRAIAADTTSFAERDLARLCAAALRASGDDKNPRYRDAYSALAAFDGHMESSSRGATAAQKLRSLAQRDLINSLMPPGIADAYVSSGPAFVTVMRALRERPRGWFAHDDRDAFLRAEFKAALTLAGPEAFTTSYGEAYPVVTRHPLAAFGIPWWNAPRKLGTGGSYAPAVQTAVFGQSFRAVWDVGNWDAGGIDIPLGESGEPGSPHYTDLNERYIRHVLTPLPFSDAAVARATLNVLLLEP
jgi:penicillin amidase